MRLTKTVARGASAAGTLALTTVGLGLAASRLLIDHAVPLPAAVNAERKDFESATAGRLAYYVDARGAGRPLLLIHSVNAAPSSHEMRPLFAHYQGNRPVYALDLPGFGHSDRADRRYTPELFAGAIGEFLRDIVAEPADVVALSLGSEFIARAALAQPELFHSLTLISPTGLGRRDFQAPGEGLYQALSFPLWAQPFYDLLASRASINLFLGRAFIGGVPADFVEDAYATSHQPGARYAPLSFLGGQLFTPAARTALYEPLTRPTLIIYDRDPNVGFDRLPELVAANELIRGTRLEPSLGLPQWDLPQETTAALDKFWATVVPELAP